MKGCSIVDPEPGKVFLSIRLVLVGIQQAKLILLFRILLEDIAIDIALIEPNLLNWKGWVSYLLEQLEAEAKRRRKYTAFSSMVKSLRASFDI